MDSAENPVMQPGPARIFVADDHALVREGFRHMLDRESDLEVVGEAENGREAVALCRRLKPDLVLMDVRMPAMDGLEATREIKAEQPEVSVLVVTTYENPDYLLQALTAGAAGYILKDAPKGRIVNAVRRVLNGESPLNQELAARLIQRLADERERHPPPARWGAAAGAWRQGLVDLPSSSEDLTPRELAAGAWRSGLVDEVPPKENLTPRELEVVSLLARGMSNPQIARKLVITRGTAKIHVEHIIRKLGVSDRTQAVVRATELGLLDL